MASTALPRRASQSGAGVWFIERHPRKRRLEPYGQETARPGGVHGAPFGSSRAPSSIPTTQRRGAIERVPASHEGSGVAAPAGGGGQRARRPGMGQQRARQLSGDRR